VSDTVLGGMIGFTIIGGDFLPPYEVLDPSEASLAVPLSPAGAHNALLDKYVAELDAVPVGVLDLPLHAGTGWAAATAVELASTDIAPWRDWNGAGSEIETASLVRAIGGSQKPTAGVNTANPTTPVELARMSTTTAGATPAAADSGQATTGWLADAAAINSLQNAQTQATAAVGSSSGAPAISPSSHARPFRFEANQGQTDAQVRFLARGPGYTLFLTPTEAVLSFPHAVAATAGSTDATALADALRMRWLGANASPAVVGSSLLPGETSYLKGADPSQWHTHVPSYGRVTYQDLYSGTNLVYYGNQGQLEYDLVVNPGADPAVARFQFVGADQMTIEGGDLVVGIDGQQLRLHEPVIYQDISGVRQSVSGSFVLGQDHQVGFAVGAYDPNSPLIIDPMLTYSTYLGGSGTDQAKGVAVDANGSPYVTGFTDSPDFPITEGNYGGSRDAFVTKFTPDGSNLLYSTYLGGSQRDEGTAIAVDAFGRAYVTGFTESASDFPLVNSLQNFLGDRDAFISRLTADGSSLDFSSFIGGFGIQEGLGVGVNTYTIAGSRDIASFVTLTGLTSAQDGFPIVNALQPRYGGGPTDAFVSKIYVEAPTYIYSTYLGGSGAEDLGVDGEGGAVAVDAAGDAYITGATSSRDFPLVNPEQPQYGGGQSNAFVAKITPGGEQLLFSTYLGGFGADQGNGIAVDLGQSVYVAGGTSSPNFPLMAPYQAQLRGIRNAFVTKFDPSGTTLIYSTFLGGSDTRTGDTAFGIAVNQDGAAYVAGATASSDFPTQDPVQHAPGGGLDAFVTKFNPTGATLDYSTFLGGRQNDAARAIAVNVLPPSSTPEPSTACSHQSRAGSRSDPGPNDVSCDEHAVAAGWTDSSDFPTTDNSFQQSNGGGTDAFISQVGPCACTPSNFMAVPLAGYQVHLTWDDYCGDDTTGFQIDVRTAEDGDSYIPRSAVDRDYTYPLIPPYRNTYYFSIQATGSCCDSRYTAEITVHPIPTPA
jgi:hypothetical protein